MAAPRASAAQTTMATANPSTKDAVEPWLPAAVNTATRIATPKAPPSSWVMLLAPDALPSAFGSTAPRTAFCTTGIAIEAPIR